MNAIGFQLHLTKGRKKIEASLKGCWIVCVDRRGLLAFKRSFPFLYFPFLSFPFMTCETCLSFTGISAEHSRDSCPILPTLRCRKCHCRGHVAAQCGESWNHWERPTTLEELIPHDIRYQWDITSTTKILFEKPRGAEGTDREWKMEIEVPKQDKLMRDFMRKNDIPTTSALECNLQRIRDWCVLKGLRLRLVENPKPN
jgi:hypothetical protein